MRPASTGILHAALGAVICFVGCGSSSDGASASPPAGDCPAGLSSATDGNGCIDSLPTGDCAAGTRAAYGQSTCAAMPLPVCPAGFSVDVSGWGCRAIVPPSACALGTIEELGSTTCAPLGDCNAAFPPANATLFVSTSGPTDATHFTTVGAAVAAATSGAVIAVSPGTYVEGVAVSRPVSIVGKCAAQVLVKSSGDNTGGLVVTGALGVSVSGITFQGHAGGVGEQGGGDLTLTDVEIDGARGVGVSTNTGALHVHHSRISGVVVANGFGFGASGGGGTLEINRSVITGSAFVGVLGSVPGTVSITQSIIEHTAPGSDGQNGGVIAVTGSNITVDSSAILQNGNNGIVCANAGSTMKVTRSTIDGVLSDASKNAEGVAVDDGGAAMIESTSIFGAAFSAVMENDKGSTLDLSAVTIVGAGNTPEQGVIASLGSTITLENTAIVGTRDYGLFVQDTATTATVTGSLFRDVVRNTSSGTSGAGFLDGFGATVTMTDSTIAKTSALGALIGGSGPTGSGPSATFTNLVISGVRADSTSSYGRGAQVSDGAAAVFEASIIADNDESSLLVFGDGSSATVKDSVLRSSGVSDQSPLGYGFAVLANASAFLSHSWVRDNQSVGLVFDTSSANVDNSVIANNPIGVYANGTSLEDVTSVPDTPTAGQIAISQSTRFADNQTKVSSQEIPLPQALTPNQ